MNTTKNTVAIELDADVFSKVKQAAQIVALSGISVPPSRLVTALVNFELGGSSPQRLAKNFMRTVMSSFKGIAEGSPEEDEEAPVRPPPLPPKDRP